MVLSLVNAMHIHRQCVHQRRRARPAAGPVLDGTYRDCDDWLEELAPHEPVSKYRHHRTVEAQSCSLWYRNNADAHMKRQIMGREVVVAITDGRLDFGPWERIFYGEFDGRRRKRVLVRIIGE